MRSRRAIAALVAVAAGSSAPVAAGEACPCPPAVSVSTVAPGFRPAALLDGRAVTAAEDDAIATAGGARRRAHPATTWRSRRARRHRVVLTWPAPVTVRDVAVVWGPPSLRPRRVTLRVAGRSMSRGVPRDVDRQALPLPPGRTRRVVLVLADAPAGAVAVQEIEATLGPSVDSTCRGCGAAGLLADGRASPASAGLPGRAARDRAWTSADRPGAHHVALAWTAARTLAAAQLTWTGPALLPRRYRVEALRAGRFEPVTRWRRARAVEERISFGPLATRALRVVQAPGGGARTRPAAMTMQELVAEEAPTPDPSYAASVRKVLRSGRDLLGERLIAGRDGPTLEAARRALLPTGVAGGIEPESVPYLPFAGPSLVGGTADVALHLVDGSAVVSRRVGGRAVRLAVGAAAVGRAPAGTTPFGRRPGELRSSQLRGGDPLLMTTYVDRFGLVWRQESFAAPVAAAGGALASYIRLTVERGEASVRRATVRLTLSDGGLAGAGHTVVAGGRPVLALSQPPRVSGREAAVDLDLAAGRAELLLVRPLDPWAGAPVAATVGGHEAARDELVTAWARRLGAGAQVQLPEPAVTEALRATLRDALTVSPRYSAGNAYATTYSAETGDLTRALGEWGFAGDAQAAMAYLVGAPFKTRPPYPNWERGERLSHAARLWQLDRDPAAFAIPGPTGGEPALAHLALLQEAELARPADACPGLLPAEAFSGDNRNRGCSLHANVVSWRGLRDAARVWASTGRPDLAARAERAADRLAAGITRAVRRTATALADGSLFVPMDLGRRTPVFDPITATRLGSYWNLVAPYAFDTGFFEPSGPTARGVRRFLLRHGSLLLGLPRFDWRPRRRGDCRLESPVGYRSAGTDVVYGNALAGFLAREDEADRLVVSLYGVIAASMTPGTYVQGEGQEVGVCPGGLRRAIYRPPNSAADATFLETLRLALVREEERRADGAVVALDLAFATPRAWLADGRIVAVTAMPTAAGPVSYRIESRVATGVVDAVVEIPNREPLAAVRLRLRLPDGRRVTGAVADGAPVPVAADGTIDLSGRVGRVTVRATTGPPAAGRSGRR